uniref:Uncharacterized protein n=1 Tax=Cacopsylla melanoneura TaxID=428564 RepID=A0A8D8UXT1_9HEMI
MGHYVSWDSPPLIPNCNITLIKVWVFSWIRLLCCRLLCRVRYQLSTFRKPLVSYIRKIGRIFIVRFELWQGTVVYIHVLLALCANDLDLKPVVYARDYLNAC